MTGYRYVVEITAAVDSSGTEQTFYVGSTGFTTLPTDTPAGTAIPPHLLNPGNYERSLFTGKRTFGAVSGNYGEVVIANHQGQYDGWIDYGFDGRRFRLYYGPEDAAYPSGYTMVLQCTMLSADFGLDAVRIKLRDRLSLLDKPVISQSFAGTGGVEGSEDQAGSPKPRLLGDTYFIPLVLLDHGLQLYFVHQSAPFTPASMPTVYDGGVALTRGSNYSSVSDMLANAPTAGQYRCLTSGPTYVRLGSVPVYTVFANSNGGIFSSTQAAIEAGIADASGTAFYLVNAYVSDAGATWLQTLNEQAQPGLYTFGFNQIDQWRVSAFAAPSGSPEYVFTQHNCISMTRQSPDGSQVPVYRVHAQSERVWIDKPTLAPSAPLNTYPWMVRKYKTDLAATNSATLTKHKLAESVELESSAYMGATQLNNYLSLFGTRRDQLLVEAKFTPELLALDLNDVVQVKWPRFGYATGKLFRVIAQRFDFSTNRFQFTLWG